MTTTTIAGHQVDVNEEGFLTQPAQWDEALAPELAKLIGLELTDAHWTLIRFLRDDYAAQGETATLRRVSHPDRHPGQGAVHPLPRQARQEDGLRLRAAQAEGMCLT